MAEEVRSTDDELVTMGSNLPLPVIVMRMRKLQRFGGR